jgi:hypothetical protein
MFSTNLKLILNSSCLATSYVQKQWGDLSLLRDVSRDSCWAPMVLFSMEFYLEIEGWRRGLRSRGLSGYG